MDKKTLKNIIIIIIVIAICVVVLGIIIVKSINENEECIKNPYIYGAKSLYEKKGIDISCSCIPFAEGKNYATFSFNKDNLEWNENIFNQNHLKLPTNFSSS